MERKLNDELYYGVFMLMLIWFIVSFVDVISGNCSPDSGGAVNEWNIFKIISNINAVFTEVIK